MLSISIIQIINIFLFFIIIYILLQKNTSLETYISKINYNIYYINLIDRKDRKKELLNELYNCNVPKSRIFRINAIRKKLGSYGCLLSHIKTLEKAKKDNIDYAVIFEDDFTFNKKVSITNIIKNLSDLNWDVCLLSGNTIQLLDNIKTNIYKVNNSQTASGYIIKKNYLPILLHFLKNTLRDNKEGINYNTIESCKKLNECPYTEPIDISWKKLQKKDNWLIIHPTIGYQRKSYSDIEKKIVDYNV